MIAVVEPGPTVRGADALLAEQAWRAGDAMAAIDAADRALATGSDPDGRAAGVAAAAAAADGTLLDAAARWRGVAGTLDGASGAWALGRAALAAALSGDLAAAVRDLDEARRWLPVPAPRGLTVLLDGAEAVVDAVRGDFADASRRLAGLAAATIPGDPLAVEPWDELAATVAAAGGDDRGAQAVLKGRTGSATSRHRLLTAWLDLRTGHHPEAREGVAAAAHAPVLRRNAVLAAAVAVGLARRAGDPHALTATWHRVAAVVAGADVDLLLLDAWGELSVGAALVSPADRDAVVAAMAAAAARAGSPAWAVAAQRWWELQRAVAADDPAAAAEAARNLQAAATAPGATCRTRLYAEVGAAWAAVLADDVCPAQVREVAGRLADAGRPWEAAALFRAAAARAADPAAARDLLGAGRGLRTTSAAPGRPGSGGLSEREREVGALVLDGLTHKEIGARLYISPKTVEQHVARLRQKLAASNRAALVAALRARLES